MKRKIKAIPIKSPSLCGNCFYSNADFIPRDCVTVKCGEPCKMFKRKTVSVRMFPDSIAFFDKNGNELFSFGEGSPITI